MIYIICAGIMGSIFLGDLWIKNHIEEAYGEGSAREWMKGRLRIRKYHNTGAAFNLGWRKRPVVAALSVLVTLLALAMFLLSLGQRGNHLLRVGLSLLLGGAFSNTYDRLKRRYVVDYFSFGVKWKPLRRLVFNISDFCILTGALLAAWGAAR